MIRRSLAVLALVVAASFAGCYTDDTPLSPGAGLHTKILLTDAPFPYDSVARVDLFIESIAASTSTDTTGIGNAEWIIVSEPQQTYNLLDLQHGTTAVIGDSTLPSAQYRALRMIIDTDKSSITSKSGAQMPVNWGWTNHPKLYALVEGVNNISDDSAQIVIDFDVGRSFYVMPSGEFLFLPVLRSVNAAATGAIEGVVSGDTLTADPKPIGDVTITIYTGNVNALEDTWGVRATGRTTADGHFRISYLMPGTYIVRSDAPRGSPFNPGVKANVVVVQKQTTSGVNIKLPKRSASNIMLTPSSRSIAVGGFDSLRVSATDSLGQAIIGAAFTWSSSNEAVVTVDPYLSSSLGLIRGIAAGTATIQACYAGSCAEAFITVGSAPPTGPVQTVTLSPTSLNMLVGDSAGFYATLRDAQGNSLSGRTITWSVADPAVVRATGFGSSAVLRALKAGTTTVTALSEGKTASASVVVLGSSP